MLLLFRYSSAAVLLLFRYSSAAVLLLVRYSPGGRAATRPLLVRRPCCYPPVAGKRAARALARALGPGCAAVPVACLFFFNKRIQLQAVFKTARYDGGLTTVSMQVGEYKLPPSII